MKAAAVALVGAPLLASPALPLKLLRTITSAMLMCSELLQDDDRATLLLPSASSPRPYSMFASCLTFESLWRSSEIPLMILYDGCMCYRVFSVLWVFAEEDSEA